MDIPGAKLNRVVGAGGLAGLARVEGGDAAAHRGALAAGGLTLAVAGTGPDRVYPARHRDLADVGVGQPPVDFGAYEG